jgi:type II secretory pathway pseudopilin PulG
MQILHKLTGYNVLYNRSCLYIKRPAESGISLLEVTIGILVLGILAAVLFGGLSTSYRAEYLVREQYNAEAVARSQIEKIQASDYINFADPLHGTYVIAAAPDGYSVQVSIVPVNPATGQALTAGTDDGVQLITVTVDHNSNTVITLQSYKVDR